MVETTAGVAVPTLEDEPIEWLGTSTPDLTEREHLLVQHAYEQGVEDGIRRGKHIGGNEAVRAMTSLATFLANRQVAESLKTLHWFIAERTEDPQWRA